MTSSEAAMMGIQTNHSRINANLCDHSKLVDYLMCGLIHNPYIIIIAFFKNSAVVEHNMKSQMDQSLS